MIAWSYIDSQEVTVIHTLQSLTGSLQGENKVFPVNFSHTGKNLLSLHGTPAMKTGFSLWEKLHSENPVFIYRDGFAVSPDLPADCKVLIQWNLCFFCQRIKNQMKEGTSSVSVPKKARIVIICKYWEKKHSSFNNAMNDFEGLIFFSGQKSILTYPKTFRLFPL